MAVLEKNLEWPLSACKSRQALASTTESENPRHSVENKRFRAAGLLRGQGCAQTSPRFIVSNEKPIVIKLANCIDLRPVK